MRHPSSFMRWTAVAASLIVSLAFISVRAQVQTVGLFLNDSRAFDGYTLFAPLPSTTTYLIDNDGLLVHSWQSNDRPGQSVYLMENGHLLRTANPERNRIFDAGGSGGRVEESDWQGNRVWVFEYSNNRVCLHHDIEVLPNGNVLMIAWEYKTPGEAIAAGRHPNRLQDGELWPEHIIEVQPTRPSGGNIVWEWHAWDHLIQDYDDNKENFGVVANHPELVDINFAGPGADWLHVNAIDYNEELDQIIISVHNFGEFWIIDHSTTPEEAAGHTGGNSGMGGDILYRWGNPQAYDAGTSRDQKLFAQHDAQWIESGFPGQGHILVFNNGQARSGRTYSSVDEIVPPVDSIGNYARIPRSAYEPDEPTWSYVAVNPRDFYAMNISGAQRLPNGNTLICDGPDGTFFEVTLDKEMVWKYVNPVTMTGIIRQGDPVVNNPVFRATRYAPDYPGLADKDLAPGDPIEF